MAGKINKTRINYAELREKRRNLQKKLIRTILNGTKEYVPRASGALELSGRILPDDEHISYNTRYARYLWYGKLMLSPSGSSWARRGEKKHLTNKDLKYSRAVNRYASKKWVLNAYEVNKKKWLKEILER